METRRHTDMPAATPSASEARSLPSRFRYHRLAVSIRSSATGFSKIVAVSCLVLSVSICAGSLAWMLAAPASPTRSRPTPFHEIDQRLVTVALGTLIGLGLGFVGFFFWPAKRSTRAQGDRRPLSAYDAVTGLPTRRLFLALLNQALARSKTTGRIVAVLVAELGEVRPSPTSESVANRTLLARVEAARIKSALQSHDAVARLDDRTFAMMIDHIESPERVAATAQKIQSTMSLPLLIEGQELLLACHMGGAASPGDGTEGEELLEAASRMLSDRQSYDGSIRFASGLAAHLSSVPPVTAVAAPAPECSGAGPR